VTDHLQEAVGAAEKAIYDRGDIHPDGYDMRLVTPADADYVVAAIRPHLEAHYREKLEARLLNVGAESIARREYQAHCESMDTPAAWSAETPEHRGLWMAPARENLRAALTAALQVDEEATRG
jgi:hypothetical protein